jgi:hypothetical protein
MAIDFSRIASAAVDAALDDGQPRRRLTGPKALAAGAALAVAARYAITKGPDLARIARVPGLSAVPERLREHMPDGLRDRLADRGWLGDEDGWEYTDVSDEEDHHVTDEGEPDDDGDVAGDVEDEPGNESDLEDEPEDEHEDEDEPEDESHVDGEPEDDVDDEPEDVDHGAEDEPEVEVDDGSDEPDDEPEGEGDLDKGQEDEEPDAGANGNAATERNSAPDVMDVLSQPRAGAAALRRRTRRPRVNAAERPPKPPKSKSKSDEDNRKAKAGSR